MANVIEHASSSDEPYLKLSGITKRFGKFTALSSIALAVERGRLMIFLGPSGCGKTTLLRIIAGLETQDEGTIIQGGRDISRLPAMRRDYGIVFQSYALFPNLTIFSNVAYGLVNRRKGQDEIKRRVAELLKLVGLPDAGSKYPGQLSGGQQQRIALARALATAPGLLLLDEPLSALDAIERVRLRGEIRALQQRLGVTTIMVTHDQEEALSMADTVVVMNHGRIEQVGTPQQIYRDPASAFVADFVGKVNVLSAVAEGAGRFRVGGLVLNGAIGSEGVAARVPGGVLPGDRDAGWRWRPAAGGEPVAAQHRRDESRRRRAAQRRAAARLPPTSLIQATFAALTLLASSLAPRCTNLYYLVARSSPPRYHPRLWPGSPD